MTSLFYPYWNYLHRKETIHNEETLLTAQPNMYDLSLLWAIVFSSLYFLYPRMIKMFLPKYYRNLDDDKKSELGSYCVAITHHIPVLCFGVYYVALDIMRDETESSQVNYSKLYCSIVPWIFGYFIADTTIYSIPQLLVGRYDYFIHHFFGLILIVGSFYIKGNPIRFVPHVLICELSSMSFNVAWLLRAKNQPKSILVNFLQYFFIISFFFTRNVNLPCMVYAMRGTIVQYPVVAGVFVPIIGIQYYWLYKIVKSLTKLTPKSTTVDSKLAVKDNGSKNK